MSEQNQEYQRVFDLLGPALSRVANDPAFRVELEKNPLDTLEQMGIELEPNLRSELQGQTFSAFWAAHRAKVEGPGALRDLPPQSQTLADSELGQVVAGATAAAEQKMISTFAPPYVPVGPMVSEDRNSPSVILKGSKIIIKDKG